MQRISTKTVLVRLDAERHRALKILSAQQDRTVNAIMIEAIDRTLATPEVTSDQAK